MKKVCHLCLIGCVLSIFCPVIAQPVLNRAQVGYRSGDLHSYVITDPLEPVTNVNPEPAGAGLVWDFSSMNAAFLPGSTSEYVDPATTLFADRVEGVDLCIKNQGGTTGPYQYVKVSDDAITHHYTGVMGDEGSVFGPVEPSFTHLRFPVEYGQQFVESYVQRLSGDVGMNMLDSVDVTVSVDAYGTVITPAGTYTDALRLKRRAVYKSYTEVSGEWIWTYDLDATEYHWLVAGIHTPVITVTQYDYDDPGAFMVQYLTNGQVSSVPKDRKGAVLRVYPNPASQRIHIELAGETIVTSALVDGSGRCLWSGFVGGRDDFFLELGDVPPGMYFLEVENAGGDKIRQKILIL